jgi:hypothetical protein
LVSPHDLRNLHDGLERGSIPADLEAKLESLAGGDLGQRFINQQCRMIIALLQARQDGSFKHVSPAESERLLQLLAYVRKDDDAVADYCPGGFVDDREEVRAVTIEFGPLLQRFKAWRLEHQVPGLWLAN